MKEADVVITPLPQADGGVKIRPALLLRVLPPFGDFLACGISTQLRLAVPEFDEVVARGDTDFGPSGLLADSVIRLGFLAVLTRRKVLGTIGEIGSVRHVRLLKNLSYYLVQDLDMAFNPAPESTS